MAVDHQPNSGGFLMAADFENGKMLKREGDRIPFPTEAKNLPCHVILEMENSRCKLSKMLSERGIHQYDVMDLRIGSEGKVRHLVKMPATNKYNGAEKSTTKADESCWFESEGCEICKAILGNDSFLVSKKHLRDDFFLYSFMAPSFSAFRKIIDDLEAAGLKPKILKVEDHTMRTKILTEKQERALWLGLQTGFFDYPRRTSTVQLGKALGIRASTLSEITRRGMHRLLEVYFET